MAGAIAKLEQIVRISELAIEASVTTRKMRRWLLGLHKRHGGDWLFKFGDRDYAVNRSALKAAHPHLFSKRIATQADVDQLTERVKVVETRQNALAARFRSASHTWFDRPAKDQEDPPATPNS